MLRNKALENVADDMYNCLWYEFHAKNINNCDDFYEQFHTMLDDAVIYTHRCMELLENNIDYCFYDHDIWGRPDDIAQAAYNCLYDFIMDEYDMVTWGQMEKILEDVSE